MKLLLDTHAAIWFYQDAPQLSVFAKRTIENPANQSFISFATIWEMSIKMGLGKLDIGTMLESFIKEMVENGILLLPIDLEHVYFYKTLPFFHGDPFGFAIAHRKHGFGQQRRNFRPIFGWQNSETNLVIFKRNQYLVEI